MRQQIKLRVWTLKDADFLVECRNSKFLQRWFRQDKDITLDEQLDFMQSTAPKIGYYGFIIEYQEVNKTKIGFCGLKMDADRGAEFSIGLLPQYQAKGYATLAMKQLVSLAFNEFMLKKVYSWVFVPNPALPFYIWKCGFKATKVKENYCYKKDYGLMDAVFIEQEI